jgi:glutamate 5-kinase
MMTPDTEAAHRRRLAGAQTWVIKVGSALVTNEGRGLDRERIGAWVAQIAELHATGARVVLVSSGAVAEGMQRLGWRQRPHALYQLQTAAAVGQMGLVEAYEREFQRYGRRTAQVLLTHDDLVDRRRYLNGRSTLRALLELGVVPVVNENDVVASEELRFADNDTLAAMVANLVEAEVLLILTDQAGLFDADPRRNPQARLIHGAAADDPRLEAMCSDAPGALGSGGMRAKVLAAARAARSGAITVIASGRDDDTVARLRCGEQVGTLLWPARERLAARKQWLAGQLQVRGRLWLDAGAVSVIVEGGRSLLPVGVTRVEGQFARGEIVACLGPGGDEVARGLVNYGAKEAALIRGRPTAEIEGLLGYVDEPELIHRDNLVLTRDA